MNIIYKAYICVCIIATISILHVWYWNNESMLCKGKHCLTTPHNILENYDTANVSKVETPSHEYSPNENSNLDPHETSAEASIYEQNGVPQEPLVQQSATRMPQQLDTETDITLRDYAPTHPVKFKENDSKSFTIRTMIKQKSTPIPVDNQTDHSKEISSPTKPINTKAYMIYEEGCKVPKIDPFDMEVRRYFKKRKNYKCNRPTIITVKGKTIQIDRNLLAKDLDVPKHDIQCALHSIHRKGEGKTDNEFLTKVISSNINDSFTVSEEFLKISCYVKRTVVYQDFFAFIHKKPQVEERCDKADTATKNSHYPKLSVVMVGIDSISSNNFRRHLPKSYQFIKAQLKAIELNGYLKLGDNTFPCLTPLLTGKFVRELKLTVKEEPFDNSSFIWKEFSKKGYRTMFGEDCPEIGLFNYAKKGFFHQPTDYYMRPFYLATENSFMKQQSSKHCFNSRMEASVVWQWLQDFMGTFQNKPIFALSLVTGLTHDFLNDAGYADKPFYEFLSSSVSKGYFNNTLLVLFSDHGLRFGSFRQTYMGQIEERHPFMFLVFPPWFKKQYPKAYQNVISNEKKLVTMFDIHKTLKDVLNLDKKEPIDGKDNERGISLFNKIPTERTCYDAAIHPQWCTCYDRQLVISIDDEMMRAAHFLVNSINKLTEHVREDCASLVLHNVTSMYMSIIGPNQGAPLGQNAIDYFVIVETVPGKGLFEGTIWYNSNTNEFDLMGDISRVNRYRDQSWCVDDFVLNKLCYCNQQKKEP